MNVPGHGAPDYGVAAAGQQQPDRSSRRQGLRLFGIFLAAEVVFVVVSALVVLVTLRGQGLSLDDPLPPNTLLSALLIPTVLAALVAVAGAAAVGRRTLWERLSHELAFRWQWRDVGIGLALGAGGLLLTLPAGLLWATWVGEDQAQSAVGELFDGQRLPLAIGLAVFFTVWLIAPLCEEVLYRGVLWRALEYWRWNPWLIFVVTTVVFSVAHFEFLRTPLLLVISIPIGLARIFTGNLLSSVVAHQANNFLPAVGLLLISQGLLS